MQLLTKAGVLNVPAWYAAGKVADETDGIDWRASLCTPSVFTVFNTMLRRCADADNHQCHRPASLACVVATINVLLW